ncbi:myosin [Cryptosporidium ryanae]|uniref:myosin n=1 Tax=Cryptosporidium ryanae TaxID=515981 RepID=UPI00351A2549|nr:myosin [Cryptosporidium ryanae]
MEKASDFLQNVAFKGRDEREKSVRSSEQTRAESLFSPGSLVWIPCQKDVWRQGVISRVDEEAIYVKVDKTMDDMTLEEVEEEIMFKISASDKDKELIEKSLYLRTAEQLSDYGVVTPDDLCELTHLHQPSILHAINSRFDLDKIYTFTGPILIAVNPYRHIKGYYGAEMAEKFRLKESSTVPHVFNIANKAFENLRLEKKSQTILISGESGAGKTETTKFVLQFLTIVGSSSSVGDKRIWKAGDETRNQVDGGSFIEEQIIQSNPLLEAFGNSRTLRNNNSSRFGKFIEIWFSNSNSIKVEPLLKDEKPVFDIEKDSNDASVNEYKIISAKINTYLLEKVRVCFQQKDERSFHIFYQLFSAAKYLKSNDSVSNKSDGKLIYKFPSKETDCILFSLKEDREKTSSLVGSLPETVVNKQKMEYIREKLYSSKLEVDLSEIEPTKQFRYLKRENGTDSSTETEDLQQFERTLFAIWTMGILNSELSSIMKVIKAIMFIGNITFVESSNDAATIEEESMTEVETASTLLSVSKEDLILGLCNKKIMLREGEITKVLTRLEAETTRDAISRALYSYIFNHIVYLVNKQISKERGFHSEIGTCGGSERLNCGILDIFGFECFKNNSFEQLCINFANERLQQIFNDYIFRVEQDLYLQEKISWDPIDFPDNGDCVQLLQQTKPLGIFPAIDEECFVPQGSNSKLLNRLIKEYGTGNKRFEIVKTKPDCFVIVHYAGPVPYCVDGFIEKNKDQISQYSKDILCSSKDMWISDLLNNKLGENSANEKGERAERSQETSNSESEILKKKNQTLGASFRIQLGKLISKIQETTPHFIRCIKPNSNNSPDEFDRVSVSEQLKYGGVLQAIQVSRAGYPVRFPHSEFLFDYIILFSPCSGISVPMDKAKIEHVKRAFAGYLNSSSGKNKAGGSTFDLELERRNAIEELLCSLSKAGLISGRTQSKDSKENEQDLNKYIQGWAVGTTRVFLKIEAFRDLEKLRVKVRNMASTKIQSVWRMHNCVVIKKSMLRRIVALQSLWRGKLERIKYKELLKEKAILEIQRRARGFLARKRLFELKRCCVLIQHNWRRHLSKKEEGEKLYLFKVCKIQATVRMYIQQRQYRSLRKSVLKAQKLWRGRVARREFKKLKDEKNEFSQIFAKYQEALDEIQKMKANCSKLEDQLFKALSERNKLKEEKETLNTELNRFKEAVKSENSSETVNAYSDEKKLLNRLLRLSSYPFSKLGLLESIPEVLFPRGEEIERIMGENGGVGTHERQIGLLFAGTSCSGDKDLLSKLLLETGTGKVDKENTLQVFTIELTNIPGARVISEQDFLRPDLGFAEGNVIGVGNPGLRESNIGERWPLNIMSISGLENSDMMAQAENFLTRTRVAVLVYDVSNIDSFLTLLGNTTKDFNRGGDDNQGKTDGILYKALESGCKVILFGNLSNVIHNSAHIQVNVEQVRKLSCEYEVITIESDSVSCLIYSIVGILNVKTHKGLLGRSNSRYSLAENKTEVCVEDGVGDEVDDGALYDDISERNSNMRQSSNNSLFSKFNDGIRAFGLKIPRFSSGKQELEKNQFLLPTLDVSEAPEKSLLEKGAGISPVINIKDEQNSSVTHILFCRDVPSEPYTMLLVARKNGVIHAYYCYKTKYEGMDGENSTSSEWSGRVEEAYSRKAHNRAITSLALSPDESEFLSTSIDMTVRRFLTTTGHAISLFSDNSPVLVGSYLPFLPSLFIVSSSKPLLRIVNVDVGVAQKIKTDSTIRALCFDSTGIYCFAACKEGRIYVLVNVAIKSSSKSSTETDFRFTDKRGMQVCSRAITNMLYVHGASDYASIRRTYANGAIFGGTSGANASRVHSCNYGGGSGNGGIGIRGYNSLLPVLVVNAADSSITIIDIRLQAPTGQIDVSNVPHVVLQVRFRISNPHSLMPLRSCFTSVNGLWIASAAEDSSVRVFQLNNESCEKESTILSSHSAPVISTAVNASSTILASGDADGVVILWRRFSRF